MPKKHKKRKKRLEKVFIYNTLIVNPPPHTTMSRADMMVAIDGWLVEKFDTLFQGREGYLCYHDCHCSDPNCKKLLLDFKTDPHDFKGFTYVYGDFKEVKTGNDVRLIADLLTENYPGYDIKRARACPHMRKVHILPVKSFIEIVKEVVSLPIHLANLNGIGKKLISFKGDQEFCLELEEGNDWQEAKPVGV